jgi:hypothetical protein
MEINFDSQWRGQKYMNEGQVTIFWQRLQNSKI